MAYSAPSTRSTGELCTAAIWNADVVANEIAIYAGALSVTSQAVGDILYASSTTQFARVAAVATGQVLASAGTGTVPAYSATPALTSVDMGGTTVYGSRAITVDTGGVLNVVLASSAGDDFTVDTDKLVVSGDSGNVGIGTASPDQLLEVIGDQKVIQIAVDDSPAGNYSPASGEVAVVAATDTAVGIFSAGVNKVELGTWTSDPLYILADDSVAMTITAAGLVGIGTTSPTSPAGISNFLEISSGTHAGLVLHDTAAAAWEMYANGTDLSIGYNGAVNLRIEGDTGFMGFGESSPAGLIDANRDGDIAAYFGKCFLSSTGTSMTADRAHFGHVDNENATDYAVMQTAPGDTNINAKAGQKIYWNIAASGAGEIDENKRFNFGGAVANKHSTVVINNLEQPSAYGTNVGLWVEGGSNSNILSQIGLGYTGSDMASRIPPVIVASKSTNSDADEASFCVATAARSDFTTAPVERLQITHLGSTRILPGYKSGFSSTGVSTMEMHASYVDLADEGIITVSCNSAAIVAVEWWETSSLYYGGLFFCAYATNTIVEVADPAGKFDVTDTGTGFAIYKGNGSGTVNIKNKTGSTRKTSVQTIEFTGN